MPTKRRIYPAILALLWCLAPLPKTRAGLPEKPNLIFILCDDLSMGDLGCFGQKKIQTPNIDRMATEGTRFTQLYSGTSVCAPARCSLMTGLHLGHAAIRANRELKPEGQYPLPSGTFTVAQLLKSAGYTTACIGKWGLGMFDTTGSPLKLGFDHFYGYNCQRHAHDYFPTYLYNESVRFPLDGKTYSQNLIADDAIAWVRKSRSQPFFLYYAITLPHANYEIDDLGIYANRDWAKVEKTYAAMVTRLDRDVGRLLGLLKELKLDEKTLVILSAGDNGSAFDPESGPGTFFAQSHGLRGAKRTMYEGGLRQGGIVCCPGIVPAGRVSDEPWAFWDFLPTAAQLSGAPLPAGRHFDGYSVVPLLTGGAAPERNFFYWELHEPHFMQALRSGDWKIVKPSPQNPAELYDLRHDPGERTNLAGREPNRLKQLTKLMVGARVNSPDWHTQP